MKNPWKIIFIFKTFIIENGNFCVISLCIIYSKFFGDWRLFFGIFLFFLPVIGLMRY